MRVFANWRLRLMAENMPPDQGNAPPVPVPDSYQKGLWS